jgi:uncharacterized protein
MEQEPAASLSQSRVSQPPHPNDPHWGVFTGLGIWAASVFLVLFVPGVLLFPYLAYSGIPLSALSEFSVLAQEHPRAIVVQLVGIIPAHLLTLLLAWAVVTKLGRYPFLESLGWTSGGIRIWVYPAILFAFYALVLVLPEQEHELMRIIRSSREAVYVIAIMATFTAPLVEEVIYRGVLYSPIQRAAGVPVAVAAVTFIFALVHVPQYLESITTLSLLTLLSLVLTLMRAYTGSILPCFILHTLVNGWQSIILIAEPFLRRFIEPEVVVRLFGN